MCLICISLDKEFLTSREALRNLGEYSTTLDPKHIEEVIEKINQKAQEEEE